MINIRSVVVILMGGTYVLPVAQIIQLPWSSFLNTKYSGMTRLDTCAHTVCPKPCSTACDFTFERGCIIIAFGLLLQLQSNSTFLSYHSSSNFQLQPAKQYFSLTPLQLQPAEHSYCVGGINRWCTILRARTVTICYCMLGPIAVTDQL